jgi:UDP-N-acetylmuramate dehydrogenase
MITFQADVPLADRTSYKIGGPARFFIEPCSEEDLLFSLRAAAGKALPVLLLGRGSNVLISDDGWDGLAMVIGSRYAAVKWHDLLVTARAGAPLDGLAGESVRRGYAGLEELSGIPGSVGGAVVMNAGAFSSTIGNVVETVTFYDFETAKILVHGREELDFGYRSSFFSHSAGLVLEVTLKLRQGNREELLAVRREVLEKRKARQPLHLPNCGSVFKRPPGNFAGALVESAGLKGYRFGNAQISEQHANFIVNLGGATAREVRHLIVTTQKAVWERFGVLLEPEVVFAGSFEEPLFHP